LPKLTENREELELEPEEEVSIKVSWFEVFRRKKLALFGIFLLLWAIGTAIFSPYLTHYNPQRLDVTIRLQGPNSTHLLGTDDFGRDVYSRIIFGTRVSLLVGGAVMLFTSLFGILFGLLAGFYKSLDIVLMRIMDGFMAFPAMVMAIALMAAMGPSVLNVIIALAFIYMPRTAQIVRSVVLVGREMVYVQAARALGARDLRITLKHILPNCFPPLIVQSTFIFAYSILAEASLSFLGVGVPPEIPSWGNIISSGRLFIREAPWLTLFPGLAILLTCLALNLLGDGLRDALDPRMREFI
jgi:peptide/nickel transport system permease protein